ncbi:MAG: hypothetical protein KDG55_14135 [Rhodocyclaceae bacterium]|nr:hypothetical protein [Rhodocyclaceae bacterium]
MKAFLIGTALLGALVALPAAAEPGQPMCPMGMHGGGDPAAMGMQREQDLLAGKGMGMAKAAELNGYPGPKHVLELAGELDLSEAQRERTQALFDAMQSDAQALGAQLVEAERQLDRLFADHLATPESMQPLVDRIGSLRGTLQARHLASHIAQRKILDDGQVARYIELRGAMRGMGQEGGPMMHHGPGGHACGGEDHEAMHRRHHPDGGGMQ